MSFWRVPNAYIQHWCGFSGENGWKTAPALDSLQGVVIPKRGLRGQRLVALFLLGMTLFNFPILALFNVPATLFGIPVLYIYLFSAWAVLIALMYLVIERSR